MLKERKRELASVAEATATPDGVPVAAVFQQMKFQTLT
jgi:hypothetical protein